VLDRPFLAVSQLDLNLGTLLTDAGTFTAYGTPRRWFHLTFARALATHRAGLRRCHFTGTWIIATSEAAFRFYGFAVPFRIVEMLVGLHEVVDSEIVLVVKKPCSSADDLLELDH